MKRYSIAPSTHRRKTTIDPDYNNAIERAKEELERLDQEKTLVLQEIDRSLSQANSVINHKIFPVLKKYSQTCDEITNNSSFWKYFFEQSALIKIESYESQVEQDKGNTENGPSDSKIAFSTPSGDVEATGDGKSIPHRKRTVHDDDSIATFESTTTNPKRPNIKQPLPHHRGAIDQSTPQWGDKNDDNSSLSMEPPQLHSAPIRKNHMKTQTIRRSLDRYHRVSISPQKQNSTPKSRRQEENRRFSAKLDAWRNSSPTMPEPPVLESGMTPQLQRTEASKVSPVRASISGTSNRISGTLRRHSGGRPQVQTPLPLWRQEQDDHFAPPELLTSRLPPPANSSVHSNSSAEMEPPELNTVEFKAQSGPNEKDNVFLETSGGSSMLFHSVLHQLVSNDSQNNRRHSDNDSENDQPSGTMFDEILHNMSQSSNNIRRPSTANESHSDSTDTSDLGSFLNTRLRSLRND